jgi:hypothetical protein
MTGKGQNRWAGAPLMGRGEVGILKGNAVYQSGEYCDPADFIFSQVATE